MSRVQCQITPNLGAHDGRHVLASLGRKCEILLLIGWLAFGSVSPLLAWQADAKSAAKRAAEAAAKKSVESPAATPAKPAPATATTTAAAATVKPTPKTSTGAEHPPYFNRSETRTFAPIRFYSATFSPDNKWMAGGTSDWTKPGALLVWDAATRQLVYEAPFRLGVRSVAFTPDSRLLAAGTFTQEILIVDVARRAVVARWKPHAAAVNGLAFSRDGQLLASASLDKTVKLWTVAPPANPAAGLPLRAQFDGHTDWVFTVAFGHDGKTLYSGGRDRKLFAWDVAQKRPPNVWKDIPSMVEFLDVSREGETLALALWDGTVELRRVKDGSLASKLTHLANNEFAVTTVTFSQDGKLLTSTATDGTAKLWDFPSGKLRSTIEAHIGTAWAASPNADCSRLMTVGTDGNLRLWDVATKTQLFQLPNESGAEETASNVVATAWSADGSVLATAHADLSIHLRDPQSAKSSRVLMTPVELRALSFSADGRRLAGAGQNRAVYMWDISGTAQPPQVLRGHSAPVTSLAFTPDGSQLFSAAEDGVIQQWDVAQAKAGIMLNGGDKEIFCLACADDGRWLAAGGQGRTIQLWDLAKLEARPTAILRGHPAAVRMLAFAPGQSWLASSSLDTDVLIWNLADLKAGIDLPSGDGVQARTLAGHQQPITSLAFSPQGHWLVTGSADKTIRTWDVKSGVSGQLLKVPTPSRSLSLTAQKLRSVGSDNTLGIWSGRPTITFPATEGRYVKLKALSAEQFKDPHASAAEIELFEGAMRISKSEWKLVSVDSEDKGTEAILAFDDNPATFWHTRWRTETSDPHPHEIIIDLGKTRRLTSLFVLPRSDDSNNGTIKDYEFSVSNDPQQFNSPVSKGELNPVEATN